MPGAVNIGPQLSQFAQQMRSEVQGVLNNHAQWVRKATAEQLGVFDARLGELSKIAQALAATRAGGEGINWERRTDRGIVRIEDIPGRRVPFTLLMDIPIGNNTTSQREQSVTISQEGPFVAVKRMATFQSSLQFQVTSGSATAIFAGRSFGRYRPIHSAWDIFDAHGQAGYDGSLVFRDLVRSAGAIDLSQPISGTPAGTAPFPVILGAPPIVSAVSNFRTMEFDGRILVINAGSSYPRQNISVPSSMWSPQINAPQELGALDFFERGEIITVQVQPNHVNNPPAGNANGNTLFNLGAAATPFPFENGQYDPHEGIATLSGLTVTAVGPRQVGGLATDIIQRLPDGILTIGWEGYRIIQPVGPV
jgi:hypothetical protein